MSKQPVVNPDRLEPSEFEAWGGFLRAHATLVRQLDGQMQRRHHLTVGEYEVLLRLARAPHGPVRLNTLAQASLLTLSGISRLVDRLEQRQLIERERDPGDRRSFHLRLTPAGHDLFQEVNRTHLEGVRSLYLRHFDSEEQRQLAHFWRRLLDEQQPSSGS